MVFAGLMARPVLAHVQQPPPTTSNSAAVPEEKSALRDHPKSQLQGAKED